MLRHFAQKSGLIITLVIFILAHYPVLTFGKTQRRYPCDPKFGYKGNYLEVSTGSIAAAQDALVCFGSVTEPETSSKKQWWDFLKINSGNTVVNEKRKVETCLNLETLPGRFQKVNGSWTPWQKQIHLNRESTTFQFALCGSNDDLSVWKDFQSYLGVDSWDDMRIVSSNKDEVMIEKLRIVQNRVRILDNESNEEGNVTMLLQANSEGNREIRLAERIRKTKLNRTNCLNLEKGPPYCEQSVPGLEDKNDLSPVVIAALLELGHSGSKKYRREDNAYCSEFAFFVIEQSVQLSDVCTKTIPNPAREDVNVKDMFRWFKRCKRLIPREEIKEKIKQGDFISVDNVLHSAIFLGWANPEKDSFWEISGNNRCLPERETFYASKNKANMVCISKRDFDTHILEGDFGGVVEN